MRKIPPEGYPQSAESPDMSSTMGSAQGEIPTWLPISREKSNNSDVSQALPHEQEEIDRRRREQESRSAVQAAHAAAQSPASPGSASEGEMPAQAMRPTIPQKPGLGKRMWRAVKAKVHPGASSAEGTALPDPNVSPGPQETKHQADGYRRENRAGNRASRTERPENRRWPDWQRDQLPSVGQDEPLVLGRVSLDAMIEKNTHPSISKAELLDRQNQAWREQAYNGLLGYAREAARILRSNPEYVDRMITMYLTDVENLKFKPARYRSPSIVNTYVTDEKEKGESAIWRQEKGYSPFGADLKAPQKEVKVWIVNGWEEDVPNPTLPEYKPELSPSYLQTRKHIRQPNTPNNPYTNPNTKPAGNGWAIDIEGNIYQFYGGKNLIPVIDFSSAIAASGEAVPGTKETRADNGRAGFARLDVNWANHFARIIAEHRR